MELLVQNQVTYMFTIKSEETFKEIPFQDRALTKQIKSINNIHPERNFI